MCHKTIKTGGNWVNTANKKMRTFRNFTDYQTVTYNIAGQEVNVSVATDLKIYAGNTVYLNKKKVAISEDDVNTIETAQAEFFITKVLYNVENNRIFYKDGAFQFKERAFGNYYEVKKEKEVREVLASLNIEIVNL